MITKGVVRKGEYFDSVTLMLAAGQLSRRPGVADSAIVMGTVENRAILEAAGLMLDEFRACRDTDLLLVVKTDDAAMAETMLAEAGEILKSARKSDSTSAGPLPRSLDAALKLLPESNLAMISVAGRYAGGEAMKALQRGLHVMLFSDNVPIEEEIALKRFAVERALLVMGPDCGTAIVNGVPLAFANAVHRGDIGIVAAAGTGLQEVSCLISNAGAGISQAIGTGGRDVKKAVGGIMFTAAMGLLADDANTKVIVLISKPPDAEVLEKIGQAAAKIRKPIVAALLGVDADEIRRRGMIPAQTLDEAASIAVAASRGEAERDTALPNDALAALAETERGHLGPSQKFVRGLFSGGTFCYEAQLLLGPMIGGIFSNAPTHASQKLKDSLHSEGHTLIDLGEDEFTVGRPHPMIDFSLRNRRILQEAEDLETAVLLLDIVLGYGANLDPLAEIVPVISEATKIAEISGRYLPIVCSVTGTDADPQKRSAVVRGLAACRVRVIESNAAACRLAGLIAGGKGVRA